jgi:serine phosphatase RsbU (regulator of sigma subunit)
MEAGSKLILFSDGITERRDDSGEMMGREGLAELAKGSRNSPPFLFVRALLQKVPDHGRQPMRDDATAIVLDLDERYERS